MASTFLRWVEMLLVLQFSSISPKQNLTKQRQTLQLETAARKKRRMIQPSITTRAFYRIAIIGAMLMLTIACGSGRCIYCTKRAMNVNNRQKSLAVGQMLQWMASADLTPSDTQFSIKFSPDEHTIELMDDICYIKKLQTPSACEELGQAKMFGSNYVRVLSDTSSVHSLYFAFNGAFKLMYVHAVDVNRDLLYNESFPHSR